MNMKLAIDDVCDWLIKGEGCVLFLGAAFSARDELRPDDGGVPSTQELIRILKNFDHSLDGVDNLSDALERRYGRSPRGLQRFLMENFRAGDDTPVKHKQVHLQAAQLPFRTVITTNCDNLLERAYDGVWKDVACVVLDEDLPKVGTKAVTLVKPHGCVLEESPHSFVFTKSQYDQFATTRPLLVHWLTAVLASHHVLFIGYGINDANIIEVIRKGLKYESLKRSSDPRQSHGYTVMGPMERPDYHRFENMTGIELVEAGGEMFMEKLVAQYQEKVKKTYPKDYVEAVFNQAIAEAPPQFILNCQMASLVDAFPRDLLSFRIEGDERAQDWFQRFHLEGLLEPTIKFGEQWFRFHRGVTSICHQKLNGENLVGRVKNYEHYLKLKPKEGK